MTSIIRLLDRLAKEPFRLFFPLGFLASAIGVSLWPAVFRGWIDYYPLEAHARWMALAFGGNLIVGFLGTAGPRLLDTRSFHRAEFLAHVALALAMMTALWLNRIALADILTAVWLLGVLASLLGRFFFARRDFPPPGMPLAVLGIAGAAAAGLVFGLGVSTTPFVQQFLRLLYFQGFLWLPILGVAPFILPRFFGKDSLHSFDDSPGIPPGWRRPFFESLAAALLLLTSFALEAAGHHRSGHILRAATVAVHLTKSVPGLASWSRVNGLGVALRIVLPCAIGGWLLAAGFQPLRAGMLHLMFIGAAGMLMLGVATRVILGHGERHDRLASPMRWCHALWGLVLFTAATRLSSDFFPDVRVSHYTYAAILWVATLGFWTWKIRAEFRRPVFRKPDAAFDVRLPALPSTLQRQPQKTCSDTEK